MSQSAPHPRSLPSDVDECATGLAQCAHGCLNTHGSFKCVCNAGYELGADGRQCYREWTVGDSTTGRGDATWLPSPLQLSAGFGRGAELPCQSRAALGLGADCGSWEMGEDRGTPGGQGSRVHQAQELRAAYFPADWQQLGWEDRASLGCHPSPGPTSLVGLATGIEMEIVNSCEADNGGCSHGCSHSSAGPICTCPRGYELDEDQRTCIGASRLLPDCRPPSQRLAAALGQCPRLML